MKISAILALEGRTTEDDPRVLELTKNCCTRLAIRDEVDVESLPDGRVEMLQCELAKARKLLQNKKP